jgi:hypothetical protein
MAALEWERKRVKPLPAARARLVFEREFSPAELRLLPLGLLPEGMDDELVIYHEEPWLNFQRSWTASCIFVLRLEPSPTGATVVETSGQSRSGAICAD